MDELRNKGQKAKSASYYLGSMTTVQKDAVLLRAAGAIDRNRLTILEANRNDMLLARKAGLTGAILDRLKLSDERINGMITGLKEIVALDDPVGEVIQMKKRPNGLLIGQKRVPLGVIGIIYESRPNVTADVFGLCLKTGNAAILRGGKEAFQSNKAITATINKELTGAGLPEGVLQLVKNTSRGSAIAMMKLNEYIDVLIPRGGAGLLKAVVENSTVPVIETGVGNCHIYIDEYAEIDQAVRIVVNAKTQRPGVCNAAEKVLVHKNIAGKVLSPLFKELQNHNVEIRTSPEIYKQFPDTTPSTDEDWGKEFLDLIIAVDVVDSLESAIRHINSYGSGHSESIITDNYSNAQAFLEKVDAAAVYVNASTRFTDGFEFGFGAEIGISTQKLHARGPMGLKELTTTKYIIYGNGQIRE